LVGWAFARFAVNLGLRGVGIFLIAATLPFAIQANYPSITHALEAALLANGLAEQAAGRRATALARAFPLAAHKDPLASVLFAK
jgi:hypothetical protein